MVGRLEGGEEVGGQILGKNIPDRGTARTEGQRARQRAGYKGCGGVQTMEGLTGHCVPVAPQ